MYFHFFSRISSEISKSDDKLNLLHRKTEFQKILIKFAKNYKNLKKI